MGRPFPTPWAHGTYCPKEVGDLEQIQENYVYHLIQKLNGIYGDVSSSLPLPSDKPTHRFQPGDKVVVKRLPAKGGTTEPPYGLPTTILAVTRTAVLTEDSSTWIHASRIKSTKEQSHEL
ncbi:hypothetical protein FKM82_018250 [Ascaphus truei]